MIIKDNNKYVDIDKALTLDINNKLKTFSNKKYWKLPIKEKDEYKIKNSNDINNTLLSSSFTRSNFKNNMLDNKKISKKQRTN